MDKDTLVDMVKDYRVALYLVLLIASIIVIFPHPGPSGLDTNLQFGLDLDGASLDLLAPLVQLSLDVVDETHGFG